MRRSSHSSSSGSVDELVGRDVDAFQDVGPRGLREGQRPQRRLVQLGDQHDRVHPRGQDLVGLVGSELERDVGVVPADRLHDHEERAHRQDRDPGAGQELGHQHDHQDDGGHAEPEGVDGARPHHPAAYDGVVGVLQVPGPVPDHPELAEVEGHEDADDVELDQPGGLGVEDLDQDDRQHGQEDDAVAVGQPVAARAQRPWGEPVLGQDRAEHGEAVEGGVGGEHQDDPGHDDHEVEARGEVVEDAGGDLRDHRVLVVALRQRLAAGGAEPVEVVRIDVLQAHLLGQRDDAEHHRDGDEPEQQQGRRGVAALGPPERRHAVGDGLDAGERGTAGRERAGEQDRQPERRERITPALRRDDHEVGALGVGQVAQRASAAGRRRTCRGWPP